MRSDKVMKDKFKIGDKVMLWPQDLKGAKGTIIELAHGYCGIKKYYFLSLDVSITLGSSGARTGRIGRSERELRFQE